MIFSLMVLVILRAENVAVFYQRCRHIIRLGVQLQCCSSHDVESRNPRQLITKMLVRSHRLLQLILDFFCCSIRYQFGISRERRYAG